MQPAPLVSLLGALSFAFGAAAADESSKPAENRAPPDALDWRLAKARVSAVKDQRQCNNASWAFATTGLLEGQLIKRVYSWLMIPLSEQDLLDCSRSNRGCAGGSVRLALGDIQRKRGIESERDYPFEGRAGLACTFRREAAVMTAAGFVALPTGDERALMEVLAAYGPVAVALCASAEFVRYTAGVLAACAPCPRAKLNHHALLVGYGTHASEGDFWILKNSWGLKWGERGYARLRRGANMCGLALEPTIARF